VTVRLGYQIPNFSCIDGVIVNMPPQGRLPGFITKAGEVLKPLVGA
jgi:hypothetical protein